MLFILPGILILGLALIIGWSLLFRTTLNKERSDAEARRREAQRAADIERWLCARNEPLYCAACEEAFRGPLDATGCPRCHTRTLVIPVRASDDKRIAECARRLPPPPMKAKRTENRETLRQGKTGK